MKVPFTNISNSYSILRNEINAAMLTVLSSGQYIQGAELDQFEKKYTEAEKLSRTSLSLPLNPFITKEEQEYVVETIKQYFKEI